MRSPQRPLAAVHITAQRSAAMQMGTAALLRATHQHTAQPPTHAHTRAPVQAAPPPKDKRPQEPEGAAVKQKALDQRLRRETPFLATIRFKNDLPEVRGGAGRACRAVSLTPG